MKKRMMMVLLMGIILLLAACQPANTPNNSVPEANSAAENNADTEEMAANEEMNAAPEETQPEEVESEPQPIEVVDGLGRTVILDAPAQRVISLAPSNTELLWAAGGLDQLVARENYANFPEEVLDIPSVGELYGGINTELVLSFESDLILTSELQTAEQVQELEDLGLTPFQISNPTDLEGMYENIRIIAKLTGHSDTVEATIAELQAQVAEVVAIIEGVEERPLVLYELDGTDPSAPWTAGAGTFVDMLITMAGGDNLGGQFADAWVQVSTEEILAQDPTIIILGDSIFGMTAEAVSARPGWEAIDAVENEQVFPFNDDLVARPGPRMVQGLLELAKLIHPELFD